MQFRKQSDDDRIGHIENLLPHLCRLKEQEQLFAMIKNHDEHFQRIQNMIIDLKAAIEELQNKDKDLAAHIQLNKNNAEKIAPAVDSQVRQINCDLKDIRHVIGDTRRDQDITKSSVNDLHDRLSLKAHVFDINEIKKDLNDRHNALSGQLTEHQRNLHSLARDMSQFLTNSLQITKRQDIVEDRLKSLSSELTIIKGANDILLAHSKDYLNDKLVKVNDQMNAKFASLPQPEKVDIEAIRKQIRSDFEGMAFDAKNASLRTLNNEQKINLIEKKIDQLFLLIKQFELNKG